VIIVAVLLWEGGGMDDVVIGRVIQYLLQPPKGIGEDLSGLTIEGPFCQFITRLVTFRKDPGFKGKSRSKGSDGNEPLILRDDPFPLLEFLPDDIAKDATIFIKKVVFSPIDFFPHPGGDDGKGDNL